MSHVALGAVIKQVIAWLKSNNINYALVGGLAVSFRTIERATQDVDISIAVTNDREAEDIVRSLQTLNYRVSTLLENSSAKRIATVRLISEQYQSVLLDLLFASSGIEREIVDSAEDIEIFPRCKAKVATISSLLAMKILSANEDKRPKDIFDIQNLLKEATAKDLAKAEKLLKKIKARGYNRQKDLNKEYLRYKRRFLSK